MLFRYAWRNLWRNYRRTVITLAAVGLNTAVLIATYSLMDGLSLHMVASITNQVVGEVQIHAPGYLVNRSMYKNITDPDDILKKLRADGLAAASRSYGYGLAALGTKSAGALFWGVDPAAERKAFDLAGHLDSGTYLPDEYRPRSVVLGKKLAASLKAEAGSEIVVLVQAADGSLGNDLFTVTGILKSVGDSIDRNAAILYRQDFEKLFVSGGRAHEIAVNSRGRMPLEKAARLAAQAAPGAEVKTWRQLLPSLSDMVNVMDVSIWLFGMIFFLAAGLGVMNTMLMATFERIREFGILKALGATPWRIMKDVTAEAVVLGVLSNVIGAVIGIAAAWYLQEAGLDTSSFAGSYSVSGVAFDPVWKAVLSMKTIVWPIVTMWFICFLAAIYPASIAARLDPVRAIGHI